MTVNPIKIDNLFFNGFIYYTISYYLLYVLTVIIIINNNIRHQRFFSTILCDQPN